MRRGRFAEDQIIAVLREHKAGVKTAELCRKHELSDATFYSWKAKYGGMTVSEAARLRTSEDEYPRLKTLLAESMLDVSALKDLLGQTDPVRGSLRCGGETDDRSRLLVDGASVGRSGSIGRRGNMNRFAGRTMLCASGCVRSRTSAVGSAIASWRSCCGVRARA